MFVAIICLLVLIPGQCRGVTSNLSYLDLIASYFQEKSLKYGTIYTCFPKLHRLHLFESFLRRNNEWVSILRPTIGNIDVLISDYDHFGVILDGECPDLDEFLVECGNLKVFDVKHHWMIIALDLDEIIEKFTRVVINIDADVVLLSPSLDSANIYTLTDIYNPAFERGGTLQVANIGNYSAISMKLKGIIQNEALYWRRRNMTGVRFKTMVVLPIPFDGSLNDYLNNDYERDVNTFNRFHARLVTFCRDYYNFSMDMQVTKSWGYTYPNGTFDGMVGELERKTIDFGSSPLFVRSDRGAVIEYGRNTWILRAEFIFRNPKSEASSLEIFLKPLSTQIWLVTGGLSVFSIILLKYVTKFERNRHNFENSWSFSTLFTLGAFCQQGSSTTPHLTCGRIIAMTIFLLAVIIYQFYSASIVSSLLLKPMIWLTTLEDVLNSPLKVGCEDTLYTRDFLQHTTDQIAKELYLRKILLGKIDNNASFLSPKVGLKMVRDGNYAFHVEVATAYPIIQATYSDSTICELNEIKLFRTQPMHANYQKNSPFRDMLDTCLQRISEYGILYRERHHWHPKKPECLQSSNIITFHVGLNDFYPALVILLMGIVISLVMLVVERQIMAPDAQNLPVYPFIH